MAFNKILLLLFSFEVHVFTRGEFPEDFILQVTPTCGSDAVEDAKVQIITDLHIHATAACNGDTVAFVSKDRVHHTVDVSYPGGAQPCLFNKRKDSEVYFITVIVSYGETGRFVHQEDEEFTVTCTFTPRAVNQTEEKSVLDGLIAAEEIQENKENLTDAVLVLQMTTVAGEDLSDMEVHLGRMVKLTATATTTAAEEVGLLPVSCVAIGGDKSYAILRSGCGDGIIIKQTEGFQTTGLKAVSPYFEAFTIDGATDLTFECNFTMCAENCDGSSCVQPSRRRRGVLDLSSQGAHITGRDALKLTSHHRVHRQAKGREHSSS